MNKPFSCTKQKYLALLLNRFRFNEAHLRTLHRYHNSLGIRSIIFLAFNERLRIMRSDYLDFMTKANHLSNPVVRTATGFHHDQSGCLIGHKFLKILPRKLLAKHQLPRHQRGVQLENILR
nr:hypothetical protein [Brucella pituitosa]